MKPLREQYKNTDSMEQNGRERRKTLDLLADWWRFCSLIYQLKMSNTYIIDYGQCVKNQIPVYLTLFLLAP